MRKASNQTNDRNRSRSPHDKEVLIAANKMELVEVRGQTKGAGQLEGVWGVH